MPLDRAGAGEPVRAVLDPNVLISALLSADASPGRVLRAWQDGEFELIVSPLLIAELRRAMAYPKLRRMIPEDEAERFASWLGRFATMAPDPEDPPPARSIDPGDDYLLALAEAQDARLVSGDRHLLVLAGELPIHAPRDFLSLLPGG